MVPTWEERSKVLTLYLFFSFTTSLGGKLSWNTPDTTFQFTLEKQVFFSDLKKFRMCLLKLEMNAYKQTFDSNMKKKLGEDT